MSEEEGAGFLARWSRRKRAAAEDAETHPAPPVAEAPGGADALPAPEPEEAAPGEAPAVARAACPIPEVPEIDPASLPPVESLTAESDFAPFLRPGVPSLLRNAALRRMWSLDPAIRDYIGPVDYQWDFNSPGGLPFGFANELTGDVSKLLAQAIGKIEQLAEEAPGEGKAAVAGQVPAEAPADPPAPSHPDPAEGVPATSALVAAAPPVVEPAVPGTPAEPVPVPRRRHGGALPV